MNSRVLVALLLLSLFLVSCNNAPEPAPAPVLTDVPILDSDGDGLTDARERELGTNRSNGILIQMP